MTSTSDIIKSLESYGNFTFVNPNVTSIQEYLKLTVKARAEDNKNVVYYVENNFHHLSIVLAQMGLDPFATKLVFIYRDNYSTITDKLQVDNVMRTLIKFRDENEDTTECNVCTKRVITVTACVTCQYVMCETCASKSTNSDNIIKCPQCGTFYGNRKKCYEIKKNGETVHTCIECLQTEKKKNPRRCQKCNNVVCSGKCLRKHKQYC